MDETIQHWIITVPQTVKWSDYLKELRAVDDRSTVMLYRLPGPRHGIFPGDRCWITYR